MNESIDLSRNHKEHNILSPSRESKICSPLASPNNKPKLISPIPIRILSSERPNTSPCSAPSEMYEKYSSMDAESESIFSKVFKKSKSIEGRKRRSDYESVETTKSVEAEFQKLLDVGLARLEKFILRNIIIT